MKMNAELLVSVFIILAVSNFCPTACKKSELRFANDSACPLWLHHNNTSSNAVRCSLDERGAYHLSLLPCYCLTRYSNSSSAVLGFCPYTCNQSSSITYIPLPANISIADLSWFVCKNYSRTGQMCGECASGYAPAVYSYTLKCVNCTEYRMNWLKYIGIAFGPQTVFFIAAYLGRLSVTSGQMVGYVTVCQVLATSIEIRFKVAELDSIYVKIISTIYAIWNLDFFRSLYPPFCVHPGMSQLAVIALDYAVALYLVFLILTTYILLTLCDKYRRMLCCWSWAYQSIHRFYQACNIRKMFS